MRGRPASQGAQHRQTDLDLIGRRATEGRREAETRRWQPDSHAVSPDEQGDDTAIEMRERRDERGEIMEDYRNTREASQEGRDQPEDREKEPEKPRWWKFWDS